MFKALQSFNSHEADVLELHVGDYICVTEEALKSSSDGWAEGFSCSTGEIGMFPLALVTRVPESDTWTLHTRIQVCNPPSIVAAAKDHSGVVVANGGESGGAAAGQSSDNNTSSGGQSNEEGRQPLPSPDKEVNADNVHLYIAKIIVADTDDIVEVKPPSNNQKLLVVRHGERIDFTFANWTKNCFTADGVYRRLDLNMPKMLPERNSPVQEWKDDPPLTTIGCYQARLVGEAMRDVNVKAGYVYTSPAFRCIQTCNALLEGMQVKEQVKMRIEPGLFEWCYWYNGKIPKFCDPVELSKCGYNIDTDYVPIITRDELLSVHAMETMPEFYVRNNRVTERAVKDKGEISILMKDFSFLL